MSESYRVLLGRPTVRPLIVALCAGWLSFGMVGLAVILTAHRATGSYRSAGVVMASFSIGASALAPMRGRLIDRYGVRPWLLVFAVGYGGALVALAIVAREGADTWPLIVCAAIAGVSAPPLNATVRGLWSSTVAESELRRAYALTALVGDVGMVAAPALCGFLFVLAPWSPLVVCALSPLVGAVFVVRRAGSRSERRAPWDLERVPFASSAMRALLVVSVALGAALGFVEVAVPAAATQWELVRYSGLLLASIALGSVVGGLWFGRRHWRRASRRSATSLPRSSSRSRWRLSALASSAGALAALLFVAGLSFGPATISLFEALDAVDSVEARPRRSPG